jgi:hypothetical protein
MNLNTQLCLIIGIPTLTVILTWWSTRSNIRRVGDNIDRWCEVLRAEGASYSSLGQRPRFPDNPFSKG